MCLRPEFPDRAYHVIIHEYLSSEDLSRVDCSLNGSQRQRFQRLMRGMPWTKFIRDNVNWNLNLIDWMRDRGVILPEGLEDKLEGRGFNPEWEDAEFDSSKWPKCPSFSLLEQFLVSDMHEAVFTMVEAGFPHEIEQPLYYADSYSPTERTPILIWACQHCYLDTIKFLVNERNASVDVYERYHFCLSAVCGMDSSTENEIDNSKRVEILRFLVDEAGADITTRYCLGNWSLLDEAGLFGRLGVVKYIHEEKKDILKLEESRVAFCAAHFFHYDLLVYLVEKRDVPVQTLMDDFYAGVRSSKRRGLTGLSLARRDKVKAYIKGRIGAEYDSDKEEEQGFDASDEEEVDSDEEEDIDEF